jgi:hypothetical protein
MGAKSNKIINQVEKEIPPPFLYFPLEEFGEIVSMPVGISPPAPEGGTGGVVIAHSHVIIITKTEFGRTGWEIEEEERTGGDRERREERERASERANCDET